MFDNPFDSFHSAVAEAKEEREQLDRLLTISTPRERVLVIVIVLTIAIFASWLFFGHVAQTTTVDGTLSIPDTTSQAPEKSNQLEVILHRTRMITEEDTQIAVGLPATLEINTREGTRTSVNGRIASIDTMRAMREGELTQLPLPFSLYKIGLVLDTEIDLASVSDRSCRVVVGLGTQSPISLFGVGRS